MFEGVKARIQDRLLFIHPLVPQGPAQRVRGRKRKTTAGEGVIEGVTEGSEEAGEVEDLRDWSYFCLDRIRYHNRWITIIWDRDGTQYSRGKGMSVSIHHVKSFIISQLFLYCFNKKATSFSSSFIHIF